MTNAKEPSSISPAREYLSRKESGPGPHALRPLDHLAFAVVLESGGGVAECLAALDRMRQEFVDWNEARVARTQELARVLEGVPEAEECARRIKEEYNGFFDKKGSLDFEFLAVGKPAENRRALAQLLPRLAKWAVSLLLFEFCPGSPLPLSDEALKHARKDGIVGKSADRGQTARILGESLKPDEAVRLVQYWELAASGAPYGEMPKREVGKAAKGKKAKKAAKKELGT